MKKNFTLLLLLLLFIVLLAVAAVLYNALSESYVPNDVLPPVTSGAPAETVAPEDLAPDFTFTDGDGNEHSLSDFFGKPTVVNFWATWCPPCKAELPAFDAAYAAYGDEVNFIMLNLTDGARETVDGVKAFVADGGYTFPVYYDTSLDGANTYAAYSIPMTVFIGADGQITAKKVGMLNETTLTTNIEYILGK